MPSFFSHIVKPSHLIACLRIYIWAVLYNEILLEKHKEVDVMRFAYTPLRRDGPCEKLVKRQSHGQRETKMGLVCACNREKYDAE